MKIKRLITYSEKHKEGFSWCLGFNGTKTIYFPLVQYTGRGGVIDDCLKYKNKIKVVYED